ncbi:MAG: DNA polymerase III subunit beta [Candidatus Babeliales bacterium]|jgi:DNA polymerase-3 subunit beta
MNCTFSAPQKDLLMLLGSMQPICNKRTTLDITESILFHITPRELVLKATDMEISLQANTDVESDATESLAFLISGKRIFELIKELDGIITFKVSDGQVRLQVGAVDLALNIKDSQEFPPFPERIENFMDMEARFFLDMLNKVAFVIPQNNANAALNGMLLEINPHELSIVATDGHSLARVTTTKYVLSEEKKWLMPKRAVLELKKLLEAYPDDKVFVGVCGNQLVFSGKNFNFFTKLIADPFPQYQSVLAREGFIPARLSKDPLVRTLKRTNCLLAGQFVSTNFAFGSGKLKVSMRNKEVGELEEELSLEAYDGEGMESRFYAPYILNGLQAFSDEAVNFYVKNNTKPIIFEASRDDVHMTYLVMPVSLAQQEG